LSSDSNERDVEQFLASFPIEMVTIAGGLRALVLRAVPEAIERLRPGWRLIGYDVPLGRRKRYFAYIAPEPVHVHLGFEFGAWLDDPHRLLEGAHLELRRVRYLTYRAGDRLPEGSVIDELVRQAARVALLSPPERVALALDRESAPPS